MIGVREGPVEIITAVAALVTAVSAPVLAFLAYRRAREAREEARGSRQTADALRAEVDPRNGKSAGRVLAEIRDGTEHNRQALDQSPLLEEVKRGNALLHRALTKEDRD